MTSLFVEVAFVREKCDSDTFRGKFSKGVTDGINGIRHTLQTSYVDVPLTSKWVFIGEYKCK